MAKHIENEIVYYYDTHPTKEDLMGESALHRMLVTYLMEVIRWLFQGQVCAVYGNLNFYQSAYPKEYPLAPDIAVIKGADFRLVRSWRIGKSGPAPQVVFEIASPETWDNDLDKKPDQYARMGVEEYFAYDPNDPLIRNDTPQRLFGWRLDATTHQMRPLPPQPDGRLWSVYLDSWLVSDGQYLRIYDNHGQLRLTGEEAEAKRAAALAEKLRSLGIDPDQL
jgi:Uma2 family endonuclease